MTRILSRLAAPQRGIRGLALALALWLAMAGAAFAAPKKGQEKAPEPTKSYVTSYILVLFALGLGMMLVIRPATRADKVAGRARDDGEE